MDRNQRLAVAFILGLITALCAYGFIETFTLATTGYLMFRWACGLGGVVSLIASSVVLFPWLFKRRP
jgi:hypothetical protein